MTTVKDQLKELAGLLYSATDEIETVIDDLDNSELTENEKKHKVSNLMLALDLTLVANRKRFDKIMKELRVIN